MYLLSSYRWLVYAATALFHVALSFVHRQEVSQYQLSHARQETALMLPPCLFLTTGLPYEPRPCFSIVVSLSKKARGFLVNYISTTISITKTLCMFSITPHHNVLNPSPYFYMLSVLTVRRCHQKYWMRKGCSCQPHQRGSRLKQQYHIHNHFGCQAYPAAPYPHQL